jgi:hypothetical protein
MVGLATGSNSTMPLRLLGVTGGDVNPALALAKASQSQEWKIIFPGTGRSLPGGLIKLRHPFRNSPQGSRLWSM